MTDRTDPKVLAELRELMGNRNSGNFHTINSLFADHATTLLADSERLGEVERRLRLAVEGLEMARNELDPDSSHKSIRAIREGIIDTLAKIRTNGETP